MKAGERLDIPADEVRLHHFESCITPTSSFIPMAGYFKICRRSGFCLCRAVRTAIWATEIWKETGAAFNNWNRQIGSLKGKLQQLGKWPISQPSGIMGFSKKSSLRSTCLLAGIIRNFAQMRFLLLRINRETNLKPREMNINIILNHHCIQFRKTNPESRAWLGLKERVVKTVFVSTAVWTSACSAVILSLCVCVCVWVCVHVSMKESSR